MHPWGRVSEIQSVQEMESSANTSLKLAKAGVVIASIELSDSETPKVCNTELGVMLQGGPYTGIVSLLPKLAVTVK